MSAPRVYWLTEEFPPETGGTGLAAAALSKGLAERGIDIEVITRQTRPACSVRECIEGVRVRRISPAGRVKGEGWRAVPIMAAYLARLLWLLTLEARRYDLIIISCMKIIPLVAVPIARVLGKRCIVRLESTFEIREPVASESLGTMNRLLGLALVRILRRTQLAVLRHADCVVAISGEIEQMLAGMPRSATRIVRIPNTVDLGKFRPLPTEQRAALRSSLGLPQQRTIALFAGRVTRAKGIGMLVEEWPKLVATHPELLLAVVGSGEGSWDNCEDYLRELVNTHQLQGHVIFTGQSSLVMEYMQAADFFVSPSEYEGFGLAVAEALASGLPAVLTPVGVAGEVIENGVSGFLFPPRDREAMRQAIQHCLEQRTQWPEIGRRAREAVAHCDRAGVFDRYVALCRDLNSRHAARHADCRGLARH